MSLSKFLDDVGYGGRYRPICLIAAPLVGVGLFVATHRESADEFGCSYSKVGPLVTDIVRKRFADSPEVAAVFDAPRIRTTLKDVVTEGKDPVSCSAAIEYEIHLRKEGVNAFTSASVSDAQVASAERQEGDKLRSRIHYTVQRTDDGRTIVSVTDGLQNLDD